MYPAGAERAFIDLVLVTGARQVAIKIKQRCETGVAKHTFVCLTIPRPFRCDIIHGGVITTGEKTRRIGNDVVAVHLTYVLVHLLTVNPGLTRTGFEMKYQSRLGHESHVTSVEGTLHVLRFVNAGIQMGVEIILRSEDTPARNAVAILVTLPVVLM